MSNSRRTFLVKAGVSLAGLLVPHAAEACRRRRVAHDGHCYDCLALHADANYTQRGGRFVDVGRPALAEIAKYWPSNLDIACHEAAPTISQEYSSAFRTHRVIDTPYARLIEVVYVKGFIAERVNVALPVLNALHPDVRLAAHLWGEKQPGCVSAYWIGHNNGTHLGLMKISKKAAEYRVAPDPGNELEVAAQDWATGNDYAAGYWCHHRANSQVGYVCLFK